MNANPTGSGSTSLIKGHQESAQPRMWNHVIKEPCARSADANVKLLKMREMCTQKLVRHRRTVPEENGYKGRISSLNCTFGWSCLLDKVLLTIYKYHHHEVHAPFGKSFRQLLKYDINVSILSLITKSFEYFFHNY